MSEKKIKARDLSYQAPLPPFLQALHAQVGGTDRPTVSGPKRAAKKRSGSEEAEDAPVVVDEDGNVVNVEVDKEGTLKESAQPEDEDESNGAEVKKSEDASKATFGARKRKVGKVIGEGAGENRDDNDTGNDKSKGSSGDAESTSKKEDSDKSKDKKPKKKAKKIKLSFDEEDG